MLRQQFRVAALVGDLATENDAVRLARGEAPVKQIITSKTRSKDGNSMSWTFYSSRTWATSSVHLLTISARIFGSFSCQ